VITMRRTVFWMLTTVLFSTQLAQAGGPSKPKVTAAMRDGRAMTNPKPGQPFYPVNAFGEKVYKYVIAKPGARRQLTSAYLAAVQERQARTSHKSTSFAPWWPQRPDAGAWSNQANVNRTGSEKIHGFNGIQIAAHR